MKRIVRLTENDLIRLVKRVIKESTTPIDPEVQKKIMECMTSIDPSASIEILLKYPTCLQTAIDIVQGKIDLIDLSAKLPKCLEELRGVNSNDMKIVMGVLNCLKKQINNPFSF
jgi:hypothetical protein